MVQNYNIRIDEHFECQTGGMISDSIVQNWTPSALECYKLHQNCANCPIKRAHYSFKCQMKKVVKTLLKTQGAPSEAFVLGISA